MAKSDIGKNGKVKIKMQEISRIEWNKIKNAEIIEENRNIYKSESIMRRDIHRSIREMLGEKSGKVEILATLNNKYPDTELAKYFEQWIDYHIEKGDLIIKNEPDMVGEDER